MEKRGQVYILVAIVLAIVIFGLVTVVNKVGQENIESDFKELSDNYASESARLINAMIADPDIDISSIFVNFTASFTSYAKTVNPKFGLIYAFYYGNELHIGNYLDTRINVQCENCAPKTLEGCFEKIPATITLAGLGLDVGEQYNSLIKDCNLIQVRDTDFTGNPTYIDVTIKDVPYRFNIKQGHPEMMIVSWENRAEQRKVFTEGDFVKEAEGDTTITLNDVCSETQRCDLLPVCIMEGQQCRVRCDTYVTEEECHLDPLNCQWNINQGGCIRANIV